MTTQSEMLEEFFKTRLGYFLVPDLVRLRDEVRPRGDGDRGGCTTATAMLVFSSLDLIGYLIRPTEGAKKEETKKNIVFALSQDAALFPAEYELVAKAIVKLFRHGVMHQLFPKACGISKPSPKNNHLVFWMDETTPHLNVDVLVDDLLVAINRLRERAQTESDMASRMESRLAALKEDDSKRLEDMLHKGYISFDRERLVCTTTTTTTTA